MKRLTVWGGHSLAPIFAAGIGLLAFSLSLGFSVANPWHTAWLLVEGDQRIHFLGSHMFRHEPWTWPPGALQSFGYPIGTSIAYTDSLPLLAYPLKVATPILKNDFQYLGLWLLVSHVLQGVFAVLLLRTCSSNRALQILGAALFIMSPPLIFRNGHAALTAHWILLACLWVYFANERSGKAVWIRRVALTAIAAMIHPYIAFMAVVLVTASHLRLALGSPWRERARIAASLSAIAVLIGAIFWANGYFVVGTSQDIQGPGFGFYSMNLLAPIMPRQGSTFWFPGPFAYGTPGQYEGYMYFGTGTLLLLALVIAAAPLRWRLWAPRRHHLQHVPLLVACALLSALALSNKVMAGETTLLEYSDSWWGPLTVFRASGRLFWPVFYLVTFGVIAAVVTWFRPLTAAVVLSVAVVIQAVDLYEPYKALTGVRAVAWENPLRSDLWSAAAPHYKHLTLIPSNMCVPAQEAVDYAPFALLAGNARITVNGGFAARYDMQKLVRYCREVVSQWESGEFADDELYVLNPHLAQRYLNVAKVSVVCVPADNYVACFTENSYLTWQDHYDLARERLPPREELERFRQRLDVIYRDELHRAAAASAIGSAETTEWIAKYLALRVAGCDDRQARSKIEAQLANGNELRLCHAGLATVQGLPPANETFDFRRDLDTLFTRFRAAPVPSEGFVDPVGEAVWIQEYLRHRMEGQSEAEAAAAVHRAIRAAAGL